MFVDLPVIVMDEDMTLCAYETQVGYIGGASIRPPYNMMCLTLFGWGFASDASSVSGSDGYTLSTAC